MKETLNYLLGAIDKALSTVNQASMDLMIESLIAPRKIFIYGVGRSGLIAQAFAVRLVKLGFDVHFVGEMTTPIVDSGDLVIIVSNTGETMSAVQTANIVRRVGAEVISITSHPNSKLGHASNLIIQISSPDDKEKKRNAPLGTIFEDASLLFFDLLIPRIMDKTGQNELSLERRHAIWV